MPGILGVAGQTYATPQERLDDLVRMEALVNTSPRCAKDPIFNDASVSASRIHNNLVQPQVQPFIDGDFHVWLDGEFYNQDQLCKSLGRDGLSAPEILLVLFKQTSDFDFLSEIDGLYSAVIYDARQQRIHLISDRFGLRYLYWMQKNGALIWSSELKAFTALSGFSADLNRQAVQQYVVIGYMLENATWFNSIELLPSGTVLSFDIRQQTLSQFRYWWWDQISASLDHQSEEAIVEEAGALFKSAIARRCHAHEDVGVTLSGGLDSRSILAAIPDRFSPVKALTFGEPGCDDVRFAKRAAAVKGAEHHVMDLSVENWLPPRIKMLWQNDGFQGIEHAGGAGELIAKLYSINLGGIALDVTLGGGYLYGERYFGAIGTDKKELLAECLGCDVSMLAAFDKYEGLAKTDFFFLQNRVRRFNYAGSVAARALFEERAPAFDTQLMEFAYSLPDEIRFDTYIYKKMLLAHFPKYYKHIPWKTTGMPIGYSPLRERIHQKSQALAARARQGLQRVGVAAKRQKEFASYAHWLRQEPARSFMEQLLCHPNALFAEYIDPAQVRRLFMRHLAGENLATPLLRYLSLEVWLQQVFEAKYRTGLE